jgi:hypothetical protein
MKNSLRPNSAFFSLRVLLGCGFVATGVLLALTGVGISSGTTALADAKSFGPIIVGRSYKNDVSPALRDMKVQWPPAPRAEHEANPNPLIPINHKDAPDTVVQSARVLVPTISGTILNFSGVPYPGVICNCAPPDTNGDVGTTQYVQIVNEGYQVFDKATGGSLLGPNSIQSVWTGFGGVCEFNAFGDPTITFDQINNRWVMTEFAGTGFPIQDECIAVSTSADATGTWNRYAFHLTSTNFIDYPKTGVWPDAYYQSYNIFNSAGTAYLGPQPFAFDGAAMRAGAPATFVTTAGPLGSGIDPILPADLDSNILPPFGAPNPYVEFPGTSGNYNIYHFHVDFPTPTNSTFTLFGSLPSAPFTFLCPTTRNCVPQLGTTAKIDGLADRLMNRFAFRTLIYKAPDVVKYVDTAVGNFTVKNGTHAAIRWFEIRGLINGPLVLYQQSTFDPMDNLWRWMGSACMDAKGNMALGYSVSSATIHPEIRYTGRLRKSPLNTLPLGEGTIIAGAGSQTDTVNRWGDYSCMAIDPSDDRTFWFTTEYYDTTTSFAWRTRIGSFQLP